jgi:hypothetical protein
MAERRMFAKTIIDSDAFLDMPVTARLLYYDLSMRADDDGFINSPKKIMKMIGASQDDLSILALRKFIIPFDNGVVVIKHWYIHNYIRKDTYNETPYKEQKSMLEFDENKAYRLSKNAIVDDMSTIRQLPVNDPSTQVRLGKVSIGKVKDISAPSYDNSNAVGKLATNKTDEYFYIHQEDIDKYKEYYPAVDVEQEIKNMSAWLDANPKNRKTHNGMPRFINGWLSREQNRTRAYSEKPKEKKGIDFFYE